MKILIPFTAFFGIALFVAPAAASYTAAAASIEVPQTKESPEEDLKDMNRGLAVCHKVTDVDDCLKIPFKEFTEKYGRNVTPAELKLFRIGQIAEVKVHLTYLKTLRSVETAENDKAATTLCMEIFKQFELNNSLDVCQEYIADMLWDLRENKGQRIAEQLVKQKAESEKAIEAALEKISSAPATTEAAAPAKPPKP